MHQSKLVFYIHWILDFKYKYIYYLQVVRTYDSYPTESNDRKNIIDKQTRLRPGKSITGVVLTQHFDDGFVRGVFTGTRLLLAEDSAKVLT